MPVRLLCCLILVVTGSADGGAPAPETPRRPTDRIRARPGPTLDITLHEIEGDLERLGEFKPSELPGITQPRELRDRLISYGLVLQSAQFTGNLDLGRPAQLSVSTNIPILKDSDGLRASIGYATVGTTLELTAPVEISTESRGISVPLKLTTRNLPSEIGARPEKTMYEKTFELIADRFHYALLDDKPIATTGGKGRLRVVGLRVRPPEATRPADAGVVESPATGRDARVELNCFQVTCSPERREQLNLDELVAAQPSSEQILETMTRHGNAFESAAVAITCDLDKATRIMQGARVPTVQDVRVTGQGVVTPSVTYEELGAILELGPGRWERSGDDWVCSTDLRLDTSGIGDSAVEATEGVSLPTFNHWRTQQAIRLRSGVPEYFISAGPPSPAGPTGKTTISVMRLVLTRPGK